MPEQLLSPAGTIEIPVCNIQSSLRDSDSSSQFIPGDKVPGY
jgi:hypothetical protein